MATTFSTVTAWMLDRLYPSREDGGKRPAGTTYDAPDGYTWQRDKYVIAMHRVGEGLSSIDPRIGDTAAGNTIGWTNGPDVLTGSATYTYECIDNYFAPLERGFTRETIVWQWFSEWFEVEASSETPL